MIVIDGLVAGGSVDAAHQRIGRIVAERNLFDVVDAAQVIPDGLPNEERERDAAASRLMLQFPVRLLDESDVRCHVSGHAERYRGIAMSSSARPHGPRRGRVLSRSATAQLHTEHSEAH
ncbi:MAG: hypothetical protein ACREKH_05465 [Candidatus Rokuibacteriota bacterium]